MKLTSTKKLPFLTILFSILMIFYGMITKDFYGDIYQKRKYQGNPPLSTYDVNFLGINIPYIYFLLFFLITLGIGIYFFVFKATKSKTNE